MIRCLNNLWNLLFPDRRPLREKVRERNFIEAANKLDSLVVTDRGGMSIDPHEIREHILLAREAYRYMVDPAHRRPSGIGYGEQSPLKSLDESTTKSYIQTVAWRVSESGTTRYACLQSITADEFAVAVTDVFFCDKVPHLDSFQRRIAQRLKAAGCGEPLAWYDSLQEAMDAHDKGS